MGRSGALMYQPDTVYATRNMPRLEGSGRDRSIPPPPPDGRSPGVPPGGLNYLGEKGEIEAADGIALLATFRPV